MVADWPTVRLRYLGELKGGAGFPDDEQGQTSEELPFFKVKHIGEANSEGYLLTSEHTVSRDTAEMLRAFVFPAGTIVFAKIGAALLLNRFRLLGQESCIDNNMMGFVVATDRADRRFLLHRLSLFDFGHIANPGAVPSLNVGQVAEQQVQIPPLETQRAIADYLDAETARIDTLIAAKENLLAILAEKRRALVTQAVTRGLDPSVPMRDSGIPWLGEIPANWEVTRLKFLLDGIEQGWSPQCDNYPAGPEDWGVMKTGCVNGDTFDEDKNKRLPDDLDPRVEYEIHPGDFLISRANTTTLVGSAALVRQVRPRLLLCDKLYRLRVEHSRLDTEFLEMFFNTPMGRYEFERDASGASGSMQNISQEAVRNVWIAVPSKSEQATIVTETRQALLRADSVAATTRETLDLLHERREAVIATTVTGQLDVEVP